MKFYKNFSGEMMAAIPGIELVEKWHTLTGLDVIVCKLSENCVKALRDQLSALLPADPTDWKRAYESKLRYIEMLEIDRNQERSKRVAVEAELVALKSRDRYANGTNRSPMTTEQMSSISQLMMNKSFMTDFERKLPKLYPWMGFDMAGLSQDQMGVIRFDTQTDASPIIPYDPPAAILKEKIPGFTERETASGQDPFTALPRTKLNDFLKSHANALHGALERDTIEAGVKPADSAISGAWKYGWKV